MTIPKRTRRKSHRGQVEKEVRLQLAIQAYEEVLGAMSYRGIALECNVCALINIYVFSSWARSTIIPLLVINHHQPIFALPNGKMVENNFIDEIWCDPTQKMVPYITTYMELFKSDGIAFTFALIDKILVLFGGLRNFLLRNYSKRKCMDWIFEHQEESGDCAGIFPPMHLGILALMLEGYYFCQLISGSLFLTFAYTSLIGLQGCISLSFSKRTTTFDVS